MKTMQFRAMIQKPSVIDRMLESFAMSGRIVPPTARPIIDLHELPKDLRDRVRDLSVSAWRAWTDDRHIWLLAADMSLDKARSRGRPVLSVTSFREDGHIAECGNWVHAADGSGWSRCTD